MTDWLHKALQSIDRGRFKVLGLLMAALVMGWLVGCEPTMPSIIPEKGDSSVSWDEFQLETISLEQAITNRIAEHDKEGRLIEAHVLAYNTQVERTEEGFEKQFEFRRKIIGFTSGIAGSLLTGGALNIGEIVLSGASLASIFFMGGSLADSKRKNKVIANLKTAST